MLLWLLLSLLFVAVLVLVIFLLLLVRFGVSGFCPTLHRRWLHSDFPGLSEKFKHGFRLFDSACSDANASQLWLEPKTPKKPPKP